MNESLLSQHMDSPGDGYAMEVNSSTTQSNENFTTTTNVFNESSSFSLEVGVTFLKKFGSFEHSFACSEVILRVDQESQQFHIKNSP